MENTVLIKKGGMVTRVTMFKYNSHYKPAGYKVVEEEKEIDLDNMSYQELQALYSVKFEDSPVGQTKQSILKRLNEVV